MESIVNHVYAIIDSIAQQNVPMIIKQSRLRENFWRMTTDNRTITAQQYEWAIAHNVNLGGTCTQEFTG